MGKTKRYIPEGDELTQISHRIRRKDIGKIHREAQQHMLSSIVIPVDNYVELPELDMASETLRDKRLDIIQKAAEEMVAAAASEII